MAWRVELSAGARKALDKLDRPVARDILSFLDLRVAQGADPRAAGKPLAGSRLGDLWRFRVGDYRIIADIRDDVITVLIVRIGHRREVDR